MGKLNQLLEWINRQKKIDPRKNEAEIMNLLFYSNFHLLTTQQSIALYKNIQHKFNKELIEREKESEEEVKAVQNFRVSRKERLMEIVTDPNFEKELKELEVDFETVKK